MTTVIDATALSNKTFVIPEEKPQPVRHFGTATLNLSPGTTYHFQQTGSLFTSFTFTVDADGNVVYSLAFDGVFLDGLNTTTLFVKGYEVAIDVALDHDLILVCEDNLLLPRTSVTGAVNKLRLVPSTYQFQPAGSMVSSFFSFTLFPDGTVRINPPCDVFPGVGNVNDATRTLTITGCAITFDGTLLTHDLFPFLLNNIPELSRVALHTLRILPAEDYRMLVAGSTGGDMTYSVNPDGTVSFPSAFSVIPAPDPCDEFLEVRGTSTLVFIGYPVVIDTSIDGSRSVLPTVTRRFALQVLVPATWNFQTSDGKDWVLVVDRAGVVSGSPAGSVKVAVVPRLELL